MLSVLAAVPNQLDFGDIGHELTTCVLQFCKISFPALPFLAAAAASLCPSKKGHLGTFKIEQTGWSDGSHREMLDSSAISIC
jgi:hypothetical protein